MRPIGEVAAEKLGIPADAVLPYGKYKAKIPLDYIRSLRDRPNGRLILVTAITPTPAGEGKTTTTVGLGDALNHIGKKAILCLREPSLGPCFGVKGGAAGGGYAQVVPMEDINLHFTGDLHAIGTANHLLASRDRHERPVVAFDRLLARRRRQRLSARGRFRHHGRVRSDGDLLSRQGSRGPQAAVVENRHRLYPRPQAGARRRAQGARADGRA